MVREKIKIVIADDNRTFRRIIAAIINKHSELEIVGEAADGNEALNTVQKLMPDVLLLDIEMPEKNGIEVLKEIKKISFPCEVIVISAKNFTEKNADITLTCLFEGAFDYINKPQSSSYEENISELENTLIIKIMLAYSKKLFKNRKILPQVKETVLKKQIGYIFTKPINLIAIGISTGGPTALEELIKQLPVDFKVPIVIIQHMPPNFTLALAKRLNQISKVPVQELKENIVL